MHNFYSYFHTLKNENIKWHDKKMIHLFSLGKLKCIFKQILSRLGWQSSRIDAACTLIYFVMSSILGTNPNLVLIFAVSSNFVSLCKESLAC